MMKPKGLYRRVSSSIHTDDKVRKLTRPQACGLALWHELLFGEQTDVVPGLFRIGEAAFAEQLGWTLKGFRGAWQEIVDAGIPLHADWRARLVWVKNAIHHNLPASPKVVLHWKRCWRDSIPECELKEEARQYIGLVLTGSYSSTTYAEAFEEVTGKAIRKAFADPFPEATRIQEAVSRKEYVVSAVGKEITSSAEAVGNPDLTGLSEADKAQVQGLFRRGQGLAALDLLANLRPRRGTA